MTNLRFFGAAFLMSLIILINLIIFAVAVGHFIPDPAPVLESSTTTGHPGQGGARG